MEVEAHRQVEFDDSIGRLAEDLVLCARDRVRAVLEEIGDANIAETNGSHLRAGSPVDVGAIALVQAGAEGMGRDMLAVCHCAGCF